MRADIESLKARFSIPFLWNHLSLPGKPSRNCQSPFREDKNPSFSVWQDGRGNWRWKDFGTGEGGDIIDFAFKAKGCTATDAIKYLRDLRRDTAAVSPAITTQENPITVPMNPYHIVDLPYSMSFEESRRCRKACEALASSEKLLNHIASWGQWEAETIRGLALDACLGWEDGRLCYVFETGMQTRSELRCEKRSDREFRWAFGKPFLWRGYPLIDKAMNPLVKTVFITEGQSDLIRFIDYGLEKPDLSTIGVAVPGANQFPEGWTEMFRDKQVFLIPDQDAAGMVFLATLKSRLAPVAYELRVVDVSKLPVAE
jgi:hypothetical protein